MMNKTLIGILVAIVIIVGMIFSSYNGLVSMNENVNGKWSQVETQLQRRNDLIPNLVSTVKAMLLMKPKFSKQYLMPVLN